MRLLSGARPRGPALATPYGIAYPIYRPGQDLHIYIYLSVYLHIYTIISAQARSRCTATRAACPGPCTPGCRAMATSPCCGRASPRRARGPPASTCPSPPPSWPPPCPGRGWRPCTGRGRVQGGRGLPPPPGPAPCSTPAPSTAASSRRGRPS